MENKEAYSEVLFEEFPGKEGAVGVITLNRPKVLNSLNHDMVLAIDATLERWETDPHIKCVVIRASEGRAFCAGGDLRLTYERFLAKDEKMMRFFQDEYRLNKRIFNLPKPYIAFLDGITMGGGVGLSIHGSHRIATERLLFAMPETGIGFYPDVGGTYFLPRIKQSLGIYLGLAGARIKADDCVDLGLCQFKIPSAQLPLVLSTLIETPLGEDAKNKVSEILVGFSHQPKDLTLMPEIDLLEAAFSEPTVEQILDKLHAVWSPFAKEVVSELMKKSPTSLKVSLQAFYKHKEVNFHECMHQELRLTGHFLSSHDFLEGIRAVIIHKDQSPKWRPAAIEEVTEGQVADYFRPLYEELM